MNKAVLISLRPKWCELIASGQKTVEVRKTKPSAILPLKCYIYETRGDEQAGNAEYKLVKKGNGRCKVIGEFVCDRIIDWSYIPDPDESADPGLMAYDILTKDGERTCLDYDDIEAYGKGAPLYGWHISDLMIYDKPKELSEFRSWNTGVVFMDGYPMPTHEVKRPPQSWMYVEELT